MNIVDVILGKPIKTSEERAEQIGPAEGIPIFGLDGLSSAAYGPEAALSLLIPLGLLGVQIHRADQSRHHHPAGHRLFLVSPNYRCVSVGGGSYTVAR